MIKNSLGIEKTVKEVLKAGEFKNFISIDEMNSRRV